MDASSTPVSSDWIPTPSDDPLHQDQGPTNAGDLKQYYYAFIAIGIITVAIMIVFLVKRAKRRAGHASQEREEDEMPLWNHRTYRDTRLSTPRSREEGLDQNGEAPPPYAPRPVTGQEAGIRLTNEYLAVPMRALSRREANLKPPDYAEVHVRAV